MDGVLILSIYRSYEVMFIISILYKLYGTNEFSIFNTNGECFVWSNLVIVSRQQLGHCWYDNDSYSGGGTHHIGSLGGGGGPGGWRGNGGDLFTKFLKDFSNSVVV